MQILNLVGTEKFALLDDIDFEWAKEFNWYYSNGYARRGVPERYLHKAIGNILGFKDETDHKDRNPLNCQRYNLRNATREQNGRNRKGTSKYKGVTYHLGKYQVSIRVRGKLIYLGRFSDEKLAALAYNKAAIMYFNEFALLNEV